MTGPSKRIVVTGGAGFVGSHLVERLAASSDADIVVIDDLSTGSAENLRSVSDRVDLVVGDCGVPSIAEVAARADLVFHLAVRNVRASIGEPRENLRVNAVATLEVLEAMRAGAQGRFLYVSSSEVYGVAHADRFSEVVVPRPTTIYGAGKLAGEHIALAYHHTYGMDTAVVRPFNNFGPRSHFEGDSGEVIPKFILRAIAGLPLHVHGDGTQTRDFMYVEDTAAWLVDLADEPTFSGEVVNIGYGIEIAVNTLAHEILRLTGSSSSIEHGPARPGDLPRLLADVAKVRSIVPYAPVVDFTEGLRRTVEYFKDLGDPTDLLDQEQQRTWT